MLDASRTDGYVPRLLERLSVDLSEAQLEAPERLLAADNVLEGGRRV